MEEAELEPLREERSLSPMLEQLRLAGACEDDEDVALLVEPLSLPAEFSASNASELLGGELGDRSLSLSGDGLAEEERRPASQPPEEGPMTWPHTPGSFAPSQPVSGVSTPKALAAPPRLFALPRLPRSLASVEVGQVAEEDSVEFRENLNTLSAQCVEKLDAMGDASALTQELADAAAGLAAAEERFAQPPSIHPADEAPSERVRSAHALEVLGNVMQASAQSRQSFAEKLRSLNDAAELAESLATDRAAATAAADSAADSSAKAVVDRLRTTSQESHAPSKQRRPSISGRDRKRSVWREVAKMTVGGGDDYRKRLLKNLDDMAAAVEKATLQYEDALALKLDFAQDGNATESSHEAAVCRERKKELDKLRILYVDSLERVHARKEAEILDRAADTFFAQREAVAAMLEAMDRAAPRFEAMRKSAEHVRAEAMEMAERRQRMVQAVEAKVVEQKDIRDLTFEQPRDPGSVGRKRAQTLAAGATLVPAVPPALASSAAEGLEGRIPRLGELPHIPSQDLNSAAENDEDENQPHESTAVGGDPIWGEFGDGGGGGDASPPRSAKAKQVAILLSDEGSPTAQPPASPVVRRETVFFSKAGFLFADAPGLAKFSAGTGIAALATPRIRERKRWVRVWCALSADGKLKMQRLPAPSSRVGATPPKRSHAETCVELDLARCEVVLPQYVEMPPGMYEGTEVLYRAVRRCTLRKTKSLDSPEAGVIEIGDEIRAAKHAYNADGQLRVQCSKGWASIRARNGCLLLARHGRPWTIELRRIPTAKQLAEAAAEAAAAAAAPSAEEGVPPVGSGETGANSTDTSPEKASRETANGSSPSAAAVPAASAELLQSELLANVQAESEEEFAAWLNVLRESVAACTARKQAQLNSSVKSWLSTIPIGGDGNRHYDPTEMLEFAWDSGLEDESPETLYMQFVEHQHQEGLRQEEQEQQEMLMMRRARMSECGVVKLPHPRIAAAVGGERSASIRSRLATEPIWVAEAAVGMLGRLQPKGTAPVHVAQHKEAARDFTRTLLSPSQDILLLDFSAESASDTQEEDSTAAPTLKPAICDIQATGDVNEDIIAKAVTEFVDIVHRCMASAFGAEGSDDSMAATDVELCNRLIGHLTVTPGMEVLTSNEVLPAMFQNKFVIVSGAGQIRIATYGFIGGPAVGDRPDRKATPYVMRMLSSNLVEGFNQDDSLEYAVRRTTVRSIREFVAKDVMRWGRSAVEHGDYSGFLKMGRAPPYRALAARRLVRKEQLEELRRQETLNLPQTRKGMYRILRRATVRSKCSTESKKLGALVEGQRVRVLKSRERNGVERCKIVLPPGIKGESGWVSVVSKDGTVLMAEEQEWASSDEIERAWLECETL